MGREVAIPIAIIAVRVSVERLLAEKGGLANDAAGSESSDRRTRNTRGSRR